MIHNHYNIGSKSTSSTPLVMFPITSNDNYYINLAFESKILTFSLLFRNKQPASPLFETVSLSTSITVLAGALPAP